MHHRTSILLAAAALAAVALPGRAAANPTCSYDAASQHVTIVVDPGWDSVRIDTDASVPGTALFLGVSSPSTAFTVSCGDATLSNTTSVAALGAGGQLWIDASFDDRMTALAYALTGFDELWYVAPQDQPATITLGSKGVSLTGAPRVDVRYGAVGRIVLIGSPLGNTVSALGGAATGRQLPASIALSYSRPPAATAGTDVIHGHAGSDFLDASFASTAELYGERGDDYLTSGPDAGPYLLDGGPGADRLVSRSGATTLHGGSGPDTLLLVGGETAYGDGGKDSFFAANGGTDTIDGGAGFDSAQVDAFDAVTDVENANVTTP